MIRQTRFGIGLWAFLLILFIHNDYAYLATSQGFWILLGMRVTVGLAILIFSLSSRSTIPLATAQGMWL
jgi:hypothetical protein